MILGYMSIPTGSMEMVRILYLHEWLVPMVNLGTYTSPMDHMGTT